MNRWKFNQGDLDVDLEDAKAEKNNISTKREGAIRCFFISCVLSFAIGICFP